MSQAPFTQKNPKGRKRSGSQSQSAPKKNISSFRMFTNPGTTVGPQRFLTKLRYQSQKTFDMTLASPNATLRSFSLNGIYDPDLSAGGQQPTGFDQLMAIYQNYRVNACAMKYSVSVMPTGTATISQAMPYIPANFSSTCRLTSAGSTNTWPSTVCAPHTKSIVLTPQDGTKVFKHYMSMKTLVPTDARKDNEYTGTSAANPLIQGIFDLNCSTGSYSFPMAGTDTLTAVVMVEQKFYVEFYSPLNLAIS